MDIPTAARFLQENAYDLIIAVDGGMKAVKELQIRPDYCVGDFDSVDPVVYRWFSTLEDVIWERHKPEKDETDTELGINLAIQNGASCIHLFGATGTRLDHTLASIGLLQIPMEAGVSCWIVDGHNRITMINKNMTFEKKDAFGKYLSLIPYSEQVKGVTVTGVKYPLHDYTFVQGNSLGVSNEILEERACVQFSEGKLIVIQSED